MRQTENLRLRRMVLVALFAAVLSVLSPWSIPIGPVSVTPATFGVFLIGMLLPIPDAIATVLLYMAIGAVGAPVFSNFRAGFPTLIGPTGGYIIGYLPCVVLTALGVRLAGKRRGWRMLLLPAASLVGLLLCYLTGTHWFCIITEYSFGAALSVAVFPFIPFDLAKLVAAILLSAPLKKALRKIEN